MFLETSSITAEIYLLRKTGAPHYSHKLKYRQLESAVIFSLSRRYSHRRGPNLLIMTLLCISFHLPSKGLKLLSRHETNLPTPPVKNSRITAFLFRERMSRYRKKCECLKLCCGAVNPDGRWNRKGLPRLSLLGILCWRHGMTSFQLKWPLPAPLSSDSSMFLLNSSWQTDGLFFEFWIAMTIPHLKGVTDDA